MNRFPIRKLLGAQSSFIPIIYRIWLGILGNGQWNFCCLASGVPESIRLCIGSSATGRGPFDDQSRRDFPGRRANVAGLHFAGEINNVASHSINSSGTPDRERIAPLIDQGSGITLKPWCAVLPFRSQGEVIPIWHLHLRQALGVHDLVLFDDAILVEQIGSQRVHLIGL